MRISFLHHVFLTGIFMITMIFMILTEKKIYFSI